MSDFLTLFDFLFTFAVVLFLVTLAVCLPTANLCFCKNPAKNNMLCFCKSPPYNHKWYWNIKKYTFNCLITNNAFLEICKTIKNKKNIYIHAHHKVFTIFNLTYGTQSLELMFWISALNGIISPGTYPDLSNLISPEIGPDLQHRQHRYFCWRFLTSLCTKDTTHQDNKNYQRILM